MSNIPNDFIPLIEHLTKWTKELEFSIYQIRESLFALQYKVKFYASIIEDIHNYKIDTTFLSDITEAKYEDDILTILIYDVPPVYKVATQSDTLKWKEMIYNALSKLPEKPYFEKAHIVFEFYVPHSVSIRADTDNRMLKTLINALVIAGIIPDDTMYHMSFSCFGYPIDNMYCKTLIKVAHPDNIHKVITAKPDIKITNKIPVKE
ncbi:conserved hypothetical protein [Caldicellulosiruptor hydrothermalis 108]|uniref:Uncharacterized protein n=1 Tax=Caldicellulosiruptor hydrothermalis (strain DSM 18901 / VKM B-2411 / 108) TaxID=632292 RepID=E4QBG5_CALH1|nr:hypothetical protein [Caldicellulosiruptor hydrothermalis]ADQ06067.1 conserved hypothetical protein [Caldicellulosiruptor hydrothermalis 108]